MKKLFLYLFLGILYTGCTQNEKLDNDSTEVHGTAGELIWVLSADGTLTISGKGEMPDYIHYNPGIGTTTGDYIYIAPWPKTITAIVINDGVTSIGGCAFLGCDKLMSVTIPNSVKSIGVGAFRECSSLTPVNIPNSVTSIGAGAFRGCSSLTTVNIPNSVTFIEPYTFSYCSGLTSVTIPNSVTSISSHSFSYCGDLTSVTIPNSVISLGGNAFGACKGLTSITIGNSVSFIEVYAFRECESLTEIINLQKTPQKVLSSVFLLVDKRQCTLYVPAGSVDDYSAAEIWTDFVNIMAIH